MVFQAAHETEMNAETLAAVLDLHDAGAAHARQRSLKVAVRAAQLAAGGLAPLPRASELPVRRQRPYVHSISPDHLGYKARIGR
jgi:hypothetical protein